MYFAQSSFAELKITFVKDQNKPLPKAIDQELLAGFLRQGGRGRPLRQFALLETFAPLEIWSENNSITEEICITIDFAPPLKKFLEESQLVVNNSV